jgi:hypothetical protein
MPQTLCLRPSKRLFAAALLSRKEIISQVADIVLVFIVPVSLIVDVQRDIWDNTYCAVVFGK